MKRSRKVTLGSMAVAVLVASGLAAWADSEDTTYEQLCVDEATMVRVDDDQCPEEGHGSRGGHGWFFIPYTHGTAMPAHPVGSKVTMPGSFARPATGNFARGGFGGVRGGTAGG